MTTLVVVSQCVASLFRNLSQSFEHTIQYTRSPGLYPLKYGLSSFKICLMGCGAQETKM